MRSTDAHLIATLKGDVDWPDHAGVTELIQEALESRRRGLTGAVDEMARAQEGDPVAYRDGLYVAGAGLDIVSWCPDEHAQEPPTQVHMIQDLGSAMGNAKAVLRLKSGVGVDKVIAALYEHRLFVWPDYVGLRVAGVVIK